MASSAARRVVAVSVTMASVFFSCVVFWVHLHRQDLDPLKSTLSRYLVGAGSEWLVAAYVVQGAALLLLGITMHRTLQRSGQVLARWPVAFLGMGGLALAAVAVGDGLWPPADPLRPDWHHYLFAGLAFLGVGVGALGQSLQCGRVGDWQTWSRRGLYLLGLALALGLLHRTGWGFPRGLGQKLVIASLLAWSPLMAFALWRSAACCGDNVLPPENGLPNDPAF